MYPGQTALTVIRSLASSTAEFRVRFATQAVAEEKIRKTSGYLLVTSLLTQIGINENERDFPDRPVTGGSRSREFESRRPDHSLAPFLLETTATCRYFRHCWGMTRGTTASGPRQPR